MSLVSMTETVFALIVFDVNDKNSFENIGDDFIENYLLYSSNENHFLYIVGNKTDLGKRQVTEQEGRDLAEDYDSKYFEVSAKTGQNIEEVF